MATALPDGKRRKLQPMQQRALLPACYGPGAFGDHTLGEYVRTDVTAGWHEHGWRVASYNRADGDEQRGQLILSAHRLTVTLSPGGAGGTSAAASAHIEAQFGAPPAAAELVTPLSKLRNTKPWREHTIEYHPAGPRLAALLALCHFAAQLERSEGALSLPTQPGQRLATALERAPALQLFSRTGNRAATLHLRATTVQRLQWRALTNPDLVLASRRAVGGTIEEHMLLCAIALVYVKSRQQGASSDCRSAVLEILLAGVLAVLCRRAQHAQQAAAGALPLGAPAPAPVLVCALPKTWHRLTRANAARTSRAWLFEDRADGGVDVSCSAALTAAEALDWATDHVQAHA